MNSGNGKRRSRQGQASKDTGHRSSKPTPLSQLELILMNKGDFVRFRDASNRAVRRTSSR